MDNSAHLSVQPTEKKVGKVTRFDLAGNHSLLTRSGEGDYGVPKGTKLKVHCNQQISHIYLF